MSITGKITAIMGGLTVAKGGFVALRMEHFSPAEFGLSLPFLSFGLLEKLEAFRQSLGRPVMISPAAGSLYRPADPKSQHFYGRAADIMLPAGPGLETAARVAAKVGFTGIVKFFRFVYITSLNDS